MQLQTQRLLLKPLSKQELQLYVLDDYSLEQSLNLICGSRTVTDRVKNAIETKIIPRLTGQVPHDWYLTFWTVIHKEQQVMVADVCFKGEPNARGEIETGYGTYPDFQQNGFMTEAVGGIIDWAFQQEGVKAILAETDPENVASHRILEKNKFTVQHRTADNIRWRLAKSE
ncbi:MAG: GNAT family N-acetyltransferase [Fluviicola sp.]|nr:GNAT family N-acetyltransferase [Fluviicola sp.]